MNEKLPDGNKPIVIGDPSFVYHGVYHPIDWLGNDPYRPRVETLVVKDRKLIFIRKYNPDPDHDYCYRIPGGSTDTDSTKEKQAEAETNEEALIAVKNLVYSGVSYYEQYKPGFLLKGGDMPIEYKGSSNDVYIAEYNGSYDKRNVEEKDLDNDMASKGRFYSIIAVAKYLRPEHCQALLNASFVEDYVKTTLRQIMNVKGITEDPTMLDHPITNPVMPEVLESIDIPGGMLFHGSTVKIDEFHPMSLDLGNIHQKPGWSTFCFAEEELAMKFALLRCIQKTVGNNKAKWHMLLQKPMMNIKDENLVTQVYGKEIYVHLIDPTGLDINIGNDSSLPEYTFREDHVNPIRINTYLIDSAMIRDHVVFVENMEGIEDNFYELRDDFIRGYYSAMLNRDYNKNIGVTQLVKAVADGSLKPGDDVVDYINTHNIPFDQESFIGRFMNIGEDYCASLGNESQFSLESDVMESNKSIGAKSITRVILNNSILSKQGRNRASRRITKVVNDPTYRKRIIKAHSATRKVLKHTSKVGGNVLNTGNFEGLKQALIAGVKELNDMDEIRYMRSDCNIAIATMTKYKKNMEAGKVNPTKFTTKQLDDYIEWLKTDYRELLNERSKEIRHATMESVVTVDMTTDNLKKAKCDYPKSMLRHATVPGGMVKGWFIKDDSDIVGYVVIDTSNGYIKSLEVFEQYRSKGFGKELLSLAERNGATQLSVNRKNTKAIELYKRNGWKEVRSDVTMIYMEKGRPTHVSEGIIFNNDDIYYNKDKFDSGEINLCFITGLSGSGKSTMGRKMSGEEIEHYELDDVVANYNFSDENLKEYGDLVYSFFKSIGNKYRISKNEQNSVYEHDVITDFVNYAIKYAKSHTDKKYVVDGIWVYVFIDPSKLKDCAVYIKGTSLLISTFRAAIRDTKSNNVKGFDKLKSIISYIKSNPNSIKFERNVQNYRVYFTNLQKEYEVEEVAMSVEQRTQLKDSEFGVPSQRKFPLQDEKHVRLAIRFFNYVDEEHEAELARRINKQLKKYKMKVTVSDNNRFAKYYDESIMESEDVYVPYDIRQSIDNIISDDKSYIFNVMKDHIKDIIYYDTDEVSGMEVGCIIVYKDDSNIGHIVACVAPEFSGFGVTNRLLNRLMLSWDILGVDELRWSVPEEDEESELLVQSYNFKPLGRINGQYEYFFIKDILTGDGINIEECSSYISRDIFFQKYYVTNDLEIPDFTLFKPTIGDAINAIPNKENGIYYVFALVNMTPVVIGKILLDENDWRFRGWYKCNPIEHKHIDALITSMNIQPDEVKLIETVLGDIFYRGGIVLKNDEKRLMLESSDIAMNYRGGAPNNKFKYTYEKIKDPKDINNFIKTLRKVFHEDNDMTEQGIKKYIKIIKCNGEFIGYIGSQRYYQNGKKYLGLGNFIILPKYQNMGHGTNVINDIIGRKKNTYDEIYCWVDHTNVNAIRFYKRIAEVNDSELSENGYYYVSLYKKKYIKESYNDSLSGTIVMEAPDDNVDRPTDYTQNTNTDTSTDDATTETNPLSPNQNQSDRPTDYTASTGDDTGEDDDLGSMEDLPTDYSDTTDSELDNTDGTDETTGDTDNMSQDEVSDNNNVVKNYSLLRDFEKVVSIIDEITDQMDSTLKAKPEQNKTLVQTSRNLTDIKTFVKNFLQFHFKDNDYSYNLYYYTIIVQLLKLNLKMTEKINLMDDAK